MDFAMPAVPSRAAKTLDGKALDTGNSSFFAGTAAISVCRQCMRWKRISILLQDKTVRFRKRRSRTSERGELVLVSESCERITTAARTNERSSKFVALHTDLPTCPACPVAEPRR
jgi:hypothetical protein